MAEFELKGGPESVVSVRSVRERSRGKGRAIGSGRAQGRSPGAWQSGLMGGWPGVSTIRAWCCKCTHLLREDLPLLEGSVG